MHLPLRELDPHRAVYVCSHVRSGAPATTVLLDDDEDLRAFCDEDHSDEELAPLHLHHLLDADPSLGAVVVCACHEARRASATDAFVAVDVMESRIEQAVAETGWFIALIEGSEGEPPFAFSIGMTRTFRAPEIIVVGLPARTAASIIQTLGERLRAGGALPIGTRITEVLDENLDVWLRYAKHRETYRKYLGYACWFNGGDWFPVVQCLWPDAHNRFPTDPDCEGWVRAEQPVLA